MSELERALPLAGPWVIGGHRGLLFFSRGRAQSEWGRGTWRADGPRAVQLTLCAGGKSYALTFDSATAPSAFTYPRGGLLGSDLGKGESPICPASPQVSLHSYCCEQARGSSTRRQPS